VGPREFYESIESTQERAIELARAGAPEGTRVVAGSQHRGRGRADHRWWSPPGAGVYLSIVLGAPPAPRTLLSLAVGTQLRATLRSNTGLAAWIKWPNDLLIVDGSSPSRKLSGILIDEVSSPSLGRAEVVGIGVNVRSATADVPTELRDRITSIEDWVRPPPSLEQVEGWTVDAATRAGARLRSVDESRKLLAECRSSLYGVGRPVRVDGVAVGRLETVGEEGELVVVSNGERVAIRVGDAEVQ